MTLQELYDKFPSGRNLELVVVVHRSQRIEYAFPAKQGESRAEVSERWDKVRVVGVAEDQLGSDTPVIMISVEDLHG